MNSVLDIIKSRRAIYPPQFQQKKIPKSILNEILEAANWAPTHKRTEPWRFRIFYGNSQIQLGEDIAAAMQTYTPPEKFSSDKQTRMQQKVKDSGCVLAICMQRDPKESLPEWEEVAAVACAVQNMWLVCTDYGIGAYWSSPSFITTNSPPFLNLSEGEKCLGLFYMGWAKKGIEPLAKRSPIQNKIIWM